MSTRPVLSPAPDPALLGLDEQVASAIGPERAAQVRSFRLILFVAQQLRYLTDQLYRSDGLTTQQATLLSVVRALGRPSLSEVSDTMLTSHQNAKQLVNALVTKGFLRVVTDKQDARVRRLVTTPKNERHWASRDPHDFEHVGEWFGTLSAEEVHELFRLLRALNQGLKQPVRDARASNGSQPG